MAQSNGILKQRRAACLKGVLSRTEEERQDGRWKRLMRRMSNITKKSLRTFKGQMFLGRNEPCYCGSGLKFKKCHWSVHAVTTEVTQVQAEEQKKRERYFSKHRKLPK